MNSSAEYDPVITISAKEGAAFLERREALFKIASNPSLMEEFEKWSSLPAEERRHRIIPMAFRQFRSYDTLDHEKDCLHLIQHYLQQEKNLANSTRAHDVTMADVSLKLKEGRTSLYNMITPCAEHYDQALIDRLSADQLVDLFCVDAHMENVFLTPQEKSAVRLLLGKDQDGDVVYHDMANLQKLSNKDIDEGVHRVNTCITGMLKKYNKPFPVETKQALDKLTAYHANQLKALRDFKNEKTEFKNTTEIVGNDIDTLILGSFNKDRAPNNKSFTIDIEGKSEGIVVYMPQALPEFVAPEEAPVIETIDALPVITEEPEAIEPVSQEIILPRTEKQLGRVKRFSKRLMRAASLFMAVGLSLISTNKSVSNKTQHIFTPPPAAKVVTITPAATPVTKVETLSRTVSHQTIASRPVIEELHAVNPAADLHKLFSQHSLEMSTAQQDSVFMHYLKNIPAIEARSDSTTMSNDTVRVPQVL